MPEPISSQVDAAQAQAPATPDVSIQQQPSAPSTPSQPALSNDPASSGTAAQPTPVVPAVPSWLSGLKEKGIDFGSDEQKAIERLAEFHKNYQQIAPIAPYVQQYMQYAPQFSKFLAEQQRAQQKQQQPDDPNAPFYKKYWNPPEYNPAWERMITRNADGSLSAVPGAPPDVVPKYLAHQQFRQEQADNFLKNPHEYMQETIQTLARQEAEKIVNERFGQVNTQQTVSTFMSQNENWLYDHDQSGRAVMASQFDAQTGQYKQVPKLSQWGQAFTDYVRQEADYQQRAGMPQDIARQRDMAMAQVQRDFAVWKLNNANNGNTGTPTAPAVPVNPQQVANDRFLAQNNPSAAVPMAQGNSSPAPAQPPNKRNINDMLKQAFKQKGITDEVLLNGN